MIRAVQTFSLGVCQGDSFMTCIQLMQIQQEYAAFLGEALSAEYRFSGACLSIPLCSFLAHPRACSGSALWRAGSRDRCLQQRACRKLLHNRLGVYIRDVSKTGSKFQLLTAVYFYTLGQVWDLLLHVQTTCPVDGTRRVIPDLIENELLPTKFCVQRRTTFCDNNLERLRRSDRKSAL